MYRVTEIIGTSSTSSKDAAAEMIRAAAETLREPQVTEAVKQDIHLHQGGAVTCRGIVACSVLAGVGCRRRPVMPAEFPDRPAPSARCV